MHANARPGSSWRLTIWRPDTGRMGAGTRARTGGDAARLRAFALPQRYGRLSDLEQALAEQAQLPPAPARSRSQWWRR